MRQMFGIASKEPLNISSLNNMDTPILRLPWAAMGGNNTYENEAVAATSDADLYNFHELSRLVDNRPQGNAHLIGQLYEKYGVTIFEKIRGPFSIGIIDKTEQKLVVATDRFGVKSVVYYEDGKKFIFGSRITTILSLQPNINEMDYEAFVDYINLSAIPTPKTIYKKIRKLPPGYFIVIGREKMVSSLSKYYDIEYKDEKRSEDYYCKNIPPCIEDSTKAILDHEDAKGNKIGAFLSGGTDSSAVTGMIRKLTGSVKAFSIGFDEPAYNELYYARIAAKHFGAEHYEYMVTPDDVLRALDIIVEEYDEPFGNASAVPTYFCARLASENGVDTLLAGDGGDEIFGGNERYASDKVFSVYPRIPSILRKGIIEPVLSVLPQVVPVVVKGKKYIRRANIPQPDRFFSYNPVMALGKETIFSPDLLKKIDGYDPLSWARELYHDSATADDLNRLLYIDMKFTITDNDLRKVTVMSEKCGIRVAYPFIDYTLVDFAAAIPSRIKVKGRYLRYIYKKALTDFLPQEIIAKPKHGFGLPIGVWIRTKEDISSFVRETLLSPACIIRTYFRENFIKELFRLHERTGATFYGDIIWLLLILELWNKRRNNQS